MKRRLLAAEEISLDAATVTLGLRVYKSFFDLQVKYSQQI